MTRGRYRNMSALTRQHQAGAGLLRRFGAGIGQADRFAQLHDTPRPTVALAEHRDVGGLQHGGLHECVEANDSQH